MRLSYTYQLANIVSSGNVGETGDVTLFFSLSGMGKTTPSADPRRKLITDDEHVWSDAGVFGSVLENVAYNTVSRVLDYDDASITENTHCAEFILNAQIPCHVVSQPKNIIRLTRNAFGVLPSLSSCPIRRATTSWTATPHT